MSESQAFKSQSGIKYVITPIYQKSPESLPENVSQRFIDALCYEKDGVNYFDISTLAGKINAQTKSLKKDPLIEELLAFHVILYGQNNSISFPVKVIPSYFQENLSSGNQSESNLPTSDSKNKIGHQEFYTLEVYLPNKENLSLKIEEEQKPDLVFNLCVNK